MMEPQAVSENQRGELVLSDHAHQLTTGGGKPGQGYPAVLYSPRSALEENWAEADQAPTLRADASKSSHAVVTPVRVRRLTPVECERLMGWPDDHTRWRADGTEVSDSVRYRMCGNGVASPVAQWLAERLTS